MNRKYRVPIYTLEPHNYTASPTVNIQNQIGTLLVTELAVTHHYHLKPIVKFGLTLGVPSLGFDKCVVSYPELNFKYSGL